MPRRMLASATGLVVVAFLTVACGSARRGEPIVGPIALSPAAARGEQVFMRDCQQCHPNGEAGLAPAINDKPLPAWLIRFQVRNGLGAMPEFSADEISSAELDDLVSYLEALRNQGRS